jgi:hypothetical protein
MLGPVGKGWSREATRGAPVERSRPIRQHSVTGTSNLMLRSRVSQTAGSLTTAASSAAKRRYPNAAANRKLVSGA